jgi:hypothetical protein
VSVGTLGIRGAVRSSSSSSPAAAVAAVGEEYERDYYDEPDIIIVKDIA